jgi:NAD(P)H-hydrate epimerase
MRDVQRAAQEEYGIDILQITENAGRSIAALAMAMLGGKGRGQRIVVLAGGGNKGSAGLCAARHLSNWMFNVEPVFGEMETEMSVSSRRQLQILRQSGIVEPRDAENSEVVLEEHLADADLVIDALVGYGHSGPVTGIAGALIELAVRSGKPILAVDIPSGMNATTCEANGPAIRASTTIMLDLPKKALVDPRSRQYAGELYLADLGIPHIVPERFGISVDKIYSEGPIVRVRR